MSYKVGDIINNVRINSLDPGTILKQLPGTISFNNNQNLWIVDDNYHLVELKSGFTWTNQQEGGNFEIIKLPG